MEFPAYRRSPSLVIMVGFGWWVALLPLILLAIFMIYLAVEWTFECI